MRTLNAAAFIAAAVISASALAQQRAAAPPSSGDYCAVGSGALMIDSEEPTMRKVFESCRAGDTIVIPGASVGVIASICDFGKAVVPTGGRVVCALVERRNSRQR